MGGGRKSERRCLYIVTACGMAIRTKRVLSTEGAGKRYGKTRFGFLAASGNNGHDDFSTANGKARPQAVTIRVSSNPVRSFGPPPPWRRGGGRGSSLAAAEAAEEVEATHSWQKIAHRNSQR